MASCTEITYVNGELVGDPLDVKMFESSGWQLRESSTDEKTSSDQNIVLAYVEPKGMKNSNSSSNSLKPDSSSDFSFTGPYVSAIIRRFEFSSALQRMSVICKNQIDGKFRAFVKGSPELIGSLCLNSSLPPNYNEVLDNYTKEGYRVIALATKELKEGFNYRKAQIIDR